MRYGMAIDRRDFDRACDEQRLGRTGVVDRDLKPENVPETLDALRADLRPKAPSWPTTRELAHAYAEGT